MVIRYEVVADRNSSKEKKTKMCIRCRLLASIGAGTNRDNFWGESYKCSPKTTCICDPKELYVSFLNEAICQDLLRCLPALRRSVWYVQIRHTFTIPASSWDHFGCSILIAHKAWVIQLEIVELNNIISRLKLSLTNLVPNITNVPLSTSIESYRPLERNLVEYESA